MDGVFICYPKCTTCQKAKRWLDDKGKSYGVAYTQRNIKENNPTKEELREWYARSGVALKRFFNTSGMLYRELDLAKRLPSMTEEEQLDLLASDGMLVKRPIYVTDSLVLIGFREAEWEKALLR